VIIGYMVTIMMVIRIPKKRSMAALRVLVLLLMLLVVSTTESPVLEASTEAVL
jgi:hypothetical protein